MLAICHYSDKVFEKPTYVTPTTIFSRTPPKKILYVQRGVFHRTSFDGLQHACDKVHSIIACSVAIAAIASSSSSSIYLSGKNIEIYAVIVPLSAGSLLEIFDIHFSSIVVDWRLFGDSGKIDDDVSFFRPGSQPASQPVSDG